MSEPANCSQLLTALVEVMKETGYVQKSKFNQQQKYKYVGEEDFINHVREALVSHGVLLIGPRAVGETRVMEKPTSSGGMMYVMLQDFEWNLAHISGEIWPWPLRMTGEGMDSGDKSIYKAATGAYKYVIAKLMMIATGDDPEKDEDEPAKPAKASKPKVSAEQAAKVLGGEVVPASAWDTELADYQVVGGGVHKSGDNLILRYLLERDGIKGEAVYTNFGQAINRSCSETPQDYRGTIQCRVKDTGKGYGIISELAYPDCPPPLEVKNV